MGNGKLYGYDSSGSDSSEEEEELEFPNPDEAVDEFSASHRRKRRRTGRNSKESAALGIFGSESEDEGPPGRNTGKRESRRLRDKKLGFVKQGEPVEDEEEDEEDEAYPEDVMTGFAGLRGTLGAAPRSKDWDIADEELEARPRLGLGGRAFSKFTKAASGDNSGTSTPASMDAHTGLGFKASDSSVPASPQPERFEAPLGRGFVSSSAASAAFMPSMNFAPPSSEPSPVIRPSFTQVEPQGKGKGKSKGTPTTPAVNPNSFAARMMAKMGYQPGQGLGKTGEGILNPIEVKLRPQGAGVGAVREMTPAARAEAKRARRLRGEVVSDSEEEAKKKKTKQRGASAGSTPVRTKKKEKTRFRTAEEISAMAKGLEVPMALKSIVDYTGREAKLLTSASGVMGGVSVEDESLKIAKRARRDLESFAGEWKGLEDRKAYIDKEEMRLNIQLDEQEEEIRRLQGMVDVVKSLQSLSLGRSSEAIEAVVSQLEVLQLEYKNEIDNHDLSEVAIAALHPLVSGLLLLHIPTPYSKLTPSVSTRARNLVTLI